jgi:hypothetical protein
MCWLFIFKKYFFIFFKCCSETHIVVFVLFLFFCYFLSLSLSVSLSVHNKRYGTVERILESMGTMDDVVVTFSDTSGMAPACNANFENVFF